MFIEWLKVKIRNLDVKKVVKGITFGCGLTLIIVMSITNIVIDENFSFIKWLTNTLIIFGIMVFGLFFGESTGKDRQMSKDNGLFQRSLRNYRSFKESIDDIIAFFIPFYNWFIPRESKDKKIAYLTSKGMDDRKARKIVENCVLDDYNNLCERAIEVNGVVIRKLQDFEKIPVYEVLTGKIILDNEPPSYFLSAQEKSTSLTITEIGKQLDKDIVFNRHSARILKLTSSLFISVVFALFTVRDFMDAGDVNAWLNLVERITALFTSMFSGILSAVIEVRLLSQKIENKVNLLKIFKNSIEKKLFIPKTEEELEQEELNIPTTDTSEDTSI